MFPKSAKFKGKHIFFVIFCFIDPNPLVKSNYFFRAEKVFGQRDQDDDDDDEDNNNNVNNSIYTAFFPPVSSFHIFFSCFPSRFAFFLTQSIHKPQVHRNLEDPSNLVEGTRQRTWPSLYPASILSDLAKK